MTATENRCAGDLPADDPNYRRYQSFSQFEPGPIAKQFAAVLIGTCPHTIRQDSAACAEHLQGIVAAHGFGSLVNEGKRRAEAHVADADQSLDDPVVDANDALEVIAHERQALRHEVVGAKPNRASRTEIRRRLSQNQGVVAQRELVGDLEYRRTADPGWIGWIVAAIVAAIESVVTLRIFNGDLSDISSSSFSLSSLVPLLALTVGLVLFNHRVAAYLRETRRYSRETFDAAIRLNTIAIHRRHHESGVAR